MIFDTTLPAIGAWLTYFVKIALAYFLAWAVCGLVRDPGFRLRVWSIFVCLAVLGWLAFCVPGVAANSLPLTNHAVLLPANVALHGIWTIQGSWAPQVSWLAHWFWRTYLLVLVLSVPHLGWKSLRLWLILRKGEEPSKELSVLFQRLSRQMKVANCKLLLHAGLHSPATAGWLRPLILLPTDLVPLLEDHQLTDVLRHELIHVRRHDYLWDRLAALACQLLFFHPAIWLAHRGLRKERELVCDLAVVRNRPELRLRYAECLAKVARWCFLERGSSPETIAFASSASLLSVRVRALLRESAPDSRAYRIARFTLIPMVLGLSVYLLPTVGLSLRWSDPGTPGGKPSVARQTSSGRAFRTRRSKASITRFVSTRAISQAKISPAADRASALPGLFSGLNSPPLPVLVVGSATPDTAANPERGSPTNTESEPRGVWDEAGNPRSTVLRPNWKSLASRGVAAGVAIATSAQDQEGREDEALTQEPELVRTERQQIPGAGSKQIPGKNH
jgi:BlaR1 peptidase M56